MMKFYTQVLILFMVQSVVLQASTQDALNGKLYNAIQEHDEPTVIACLAGDVDVNAIVDYCGASSMLHVAVSFGTLNIVKILIERGADKDKCCSQSDLTPVQIAILSDNVQKCEILKYLIEAGSDIDAVNEEGQTAVHYAVMHSFDRNILQALLNAGADIDKTNVNGRRPLHLATQFYSFPQKYKNTAVLANLAVLLQIKGDTTDVDNKGQTALYICDPVAYSRVIAGDSLQVSMKAQLLVSGAFDATHGSGV